MSWNECLSEKFLVTPMLLGSLDYDFDIKTSSCFGECKFVTNFQAKTEQKISYSPDFRASHAP